MVAEPARLHRAAGPAPGPHDGAVLNGDPRWEAAGPLGGAALAAFRAAAGLDGAEPELAWADAVELVRERSRLTGWEPCGTVSAGGACHLLPAVDGWVAVSLPRPDDLDLLPAWLGTEPGPPADEWVPWPEVAAAIAGRGAVEVVGAGQELGLAVAVVAPPAATGPGAPTAVDEQLAARGTVDPCRPWLVHAAGPPVAAGRRLDELTVVDLSSLWAGPTCARLLAGAGARVVKVESTTRPDGARRGNAELYERLHRGQEEVALPFEHEAGRAALRELLASADVVIEGSRPRALERLGIDPGEVVAARPGAVWLSITAYGRTGPWRNRVGFGDDCAAAGGLVAWSAAGPSFVGDAVADPLTGLVGAALVARHVGAGGGVVVDLALREVARAAALGAQVDW